MKMKKFLVIALFSTAVLWSCGGDDDECVTTGITYTKDIKVLLTSCAVAGCHNAGSIVGSYATYEDTKLSIGFGRIIGSLKHEKDFSPMPKGGTKWSDCNISKIDAWIKAGMPE
jgi:hypothetical protein